MLQNRNGRREVRITLLQKTEEGSSRKDEAGAPGAMEQPSGEKSGREERGMAQSGEGWKSEGNFNLGKATGWLTDTDGGR